MSASQHLASHAARLLGARASAGTPADTTTELLADQVASALGVVRPAGERTLNAQDNLALRLLLEERRLLGTESNSDAIDAALRSGSLILAAHGTRGAKPGQARGMTMVLSGSLDAPLCAFTHEQSLRAHVGELPVTAWVTESLKVWQFALQVVRRAVVIDPGCGTELLLDTPRLRRLAA